MKNMKNIKEIIADKRSLEKVYYVMKKIRLVEERIAFEYPKNELDLCCF